MDLIEQLRRDEGVRYTPYPDQFGNQTVGCVHKLVSGDSFIYPLTDPEVNTILNADIADKQDQIAPYAWFANLDSVRCGAITNMAFNVGTHGLLGFPHMISCLAKQDWQGAHDQMLDSVWATQVGDRATRLAIQILTGEWQ